MTDETTTRPVAEFALKFRGYSRRQVDKYVDAMRRLFDQATAQTEAAHAEAARWREEAIQFGHRVAELEQQLSESPPRSFAAVRERLARILEQTEGAAATVMAEAEAEAKEVVASTRERAEASAAATATHLIGQAREILAESEAQRGKLLEVLAAERSQREELLAGLAPLSIGLSQVLPGVTQLQESLLRNVGKLTSKSDKGPHDSEPVGAEMEAAKAEVVEGAPAPSPIAAPASGPEVPDPDSGSVAAT
jgi:cell division septum initiation protein DivIVA